MSGRRPRAARRRGSAGHRCRVRQPARQGALRRHRRGGHVRDRAHHARPGGPGVRQRRQALRHARRAGRARRRRARGARRGATSAARTRSWSPPPSARTTRSWPRRAGAALRVLHRAAALASVMLGKRSSPWRARTARPPRPAMLTTILLTSGADPGYAIGGAADRDRARRRLGRRRRLRRRGGRERPLVPAARRPTPRSSPTSRPTTSTTTPTSRRSRTRSRRSPAASRPAACWCCAPTTRAPGRWPPPSAVLAAAGGQLRRSPAADYQVTDVRPRGMGISLASRPAASDSQRRQGAAAADRARGAGPAQRAERGGRVRRRGRARRVLGAGRRRAGRLPRRAAQAGAQGRRPPGSGCSTATPITPPS